MNKCFGSLSFSSWQGNHDICCEWKQNHRLFSYFMIFYIKSYSDTSNIIVLIASFYKKHGSLKVKQVPFLPWKLFLSSTVYLYDNKKCKHFRKCQIIQLLTSYKIQFSISLFELFLLYSMFCSQLSVFFVGVIYIIIHLSGTQPFQAGICSNVSNG